MTTAVRNSTLQEAANALNAAAGQINAVQKAGAEWTGPEQDRPVLMLGEIIAFGHAQATLALAEAVTTIVAGAAGAGAPPRLVVPR